MVLLKKLPGRGRAHLTSLSSTVDAVGVSSKHPAGPLPPTSETLLAAISDFLTDRGPITFTPSFLFLPLSRPLLNYYSNIPAIICMPAKSSPASPFLIPDLILGEDGGTSLHRPRS